MKQVNLVPNYCKNLELYRAYSESSLIRFLCTYLINKVPSDVRVDVVGSVTVHEASQLCGVALVQCRCGPRHVFL